MEEKKKEGIFINGKAQAIEILKMLNKDEKTRLLKQIRLRNPNIADELSEKSYSLKNLFDLSDHELRLIGQYTDQNVLGVVLKACPINFQRRILSLIDRSKAEVAYRILTTQLSNERASIEKAQARIMSVVVALTKRGQIEI